MNIEVLSPAQLRRAAQIKEQINRLNGELSRMLGGSSKPAVTNGVKRKLSAGARAKIVAAQKARWAKFHAEKKKTPATK